MPEDFSTRPLRPRPVPSKRSQSKPTPAWPIEQLPGLSAQEQQRLSDCGIHTTADLLQQTQGDRPLQALAIALGRPAKHLKKWSILANLAQVPSVGCTYCGLLLHAGISSPQQLAQASPHRLHPQILRLHVATLRRRDLTPTVSEVSQWIAQAKLLVSE